MDCLKGSCTPEENLLASLSLGQPLMPAIPALRPEVRRFVVMFRKDLGWGSTLDGPYIVSFTM